MKKLKEGDLVNYDGKDGVFKIVKFWDGGRGRRACLQKISPATKAPIEGFGKSNYLPAAGISKINLVA